MHIPEMVDHPDVCVCMYLWFIVVLLHYELVYPSGWCVVTVVHPEASDSFSVTLVLHLVAPLKSSYLFGQVGKKGCTSWVSPYKFWRFMGLNFIYWSHTDPFASASQTWARLFSYFFLEAHPISKVSVRCPTQSLFTAHTNNVWTVKCLCHFFRGSWILFWVAFVIVRSAHRWGGIIFFQLMQKCRQSWIFQLSDCVLSCAFSLGWMGVIVNSL